jgi:hypothetical protein
MKHTVLALLLSTGFLASGCAHGGAASGPHHMDATTAIVILGVAVAGVALITAAAASGSQECTDPLGRCGSYDLPPPESRQGFSR